MSQVLSQFNFGIVRNTSYPRVIITQIWGSLYMPCLFRFDFTCHGMCYQACGRFRFTNFIYHARSCLKFKVSRVPSPMLWVELPFYKVGIRDELIRQIPMTHLPHQQSVPYLGWERGIYVIISTMIYCHKEVQAQYSLYVTGHLRVHSKYVPSLTEHDKRGISARSHYLISIWIMTPIHSENAFIDPAPRSIVGNTVVTNISPKTE